MNFDDVILFPDKLVEDVLKPENVTYIREVTAEANASVDESKRPAWSRVLTESLQWRHNGRDGVSNHQPHHCLLNYFSHR